MLDLCSLQSLYLQHVQNNLTDFEKAIYQFLKLDAIPSVQMIEECKWIEPLLSEEKLINNWKNLLTLNILCHLTQLSSVDLSAKVHFFERHVWNQNSQYFRSIVALNHALAHLPIPNVGPHLLENGAALIDLKEYCPWLALPFTPQHFEFGIFLCILALLTDRQDLKEVVLRLAQWQLNTLDTQATPFAGLFAKEQESQTLYSLCLSYLLFRGAAILDDKTPFAALAEVALKNIQNYLNQVEDSIDPLWPLIEKWFEQYPIVSSTSLTMPENIYDPSTALVGYRSSSQHAVCTLHGEHTGLGVFKLEEVEIVNYGPQYLPLGECQGFGIEGNSLSDQGIRRSSIEYRRHSFSLKGCTRLVDQPAASPLDLNIFRGIWLEVEQEFKKPYLSLKTSFLGLDGWDCVAFSFFVKAARCRLQSNQILIPRTLERYEGEVQSVIFEKGETQLELRSSFKGQMQVIPLAGGNNFWGGDFLIAYLMSSDQSQYQWQLGPIR